MESQTRETAGAKLAAASRANADSIGVGLPVILMWLAQEYAGLSMPLEVAIAAGGVLGSIGAKIKARL